MQYEAKLKVKRFYDGFSRQFVEIPERLIIITIWGKGKNGRLQFVYNDTRYSINKDLISIVRRMDHV